MGFLGIYTALYDYQPQGETELAIQEGVLLYVLDKGEDDWWKAKKKAADDEDEEPVGLVPANYVQEAKPSYTAKALYDYSRQTDEEVSFAEDAVLSVFDTSDPDWTLVGVNEDYGFAPFNYIEISEVETEKSPKLDKELPSAPLADRQESRSPPPTSSPAVLAKGPAATLANVLGRGSRAPSRSVSGPPPSAPHQPTSEPSDEEVAPALPRRPPSHQFSLPPIQYTTQREEEGPHEEEDSAPPAVAASPRLPRTPRNFREEEPPLRSPGGFHLYNISEMVSTMGKRKKLPTILGLNLAKGMVMISPEKSRDGPAQEWTADKITHYSLEGKHVFLELVRPSKSLDLHAGAKDTAEEIASTLGEIAGLARAEGFREVIAAASGSAGMRAGQILYDFMAQGDDEVTVAAGDDVVVLDNTKSDEWWMVRRLRNGNEGVVPSSYVEVTGKVPGEQSSRAGVNAGRSTVEQNRLEEERLAKQAAKKRANSRSEADFDNDTRDNELSPGVKPPNRGSSLTSDGPGRRGKRSSRSEGKHSKPRPDPAKTRTWTDRSGSFKVEAQFIGVSDGKIHLHKSNGVKIAVPIAKMAPEDLAYVEKATGDSLDDDTPLGYIKRKKGGKAGASIEQAAASGHDWFEFFLKAGVGPHQCERYAQNMKKDSMDESNLPDITPEILRTLGLKEGDILRVMKHLDGLHGRGGNDADRKNGAGSTANGIFSGPGGALHNNTTRKGRPEGNRAVSDVVDPKVFEQANGRRRSPPGDSQATTRASATVQSQAPSGFDDDAWEVKGSRERSTVSQSASSSKPSISTPAQPQVTGAMAELSLLSLPLQPTVMSPQPPSQQPPQLQNQQQRDIQTATPTQVQQPLPTGANPSFFGQLNPQQTGLPGSQGIATMQPPNGNFYPTSQLSLPRQRPEAPPQISSPGTLLPPPPRPLSAPQNFQQQNQFGPPPLQPQLTGIPNNLAQQASPGQSLNELNQQRSHQQFGFQQQQQLQSQMTGFPQQATGFSQLPGGFHSQPYLNGNVGGSPFADPRPPFQPQPTGPANFNTYNNQQVGINSVLPPALQPQPTGFQVGPPPQIQQQQTAFLQTQPTGIQQQFQPQQTGFVQQPQPQNRFANSSSPFQQQAPPPAMPSIPPMPPLQQQLTAAPLPLQHNPAPPMRFGVSEAANKLSPQPTGRRANLAHATAQNPFGF